MREVAAAIADGAKVGRMCELSSETSGRGGRMMRTTTVADRRYGRNAVGISGIGGMDGMRPGKTHIVIILTCRFGLLRGGKREV